MGGGNSTPARTVTLEDDGSGVVKVSEDVAKRLMGQTVYPATSMKQGVQPRKEQGFRKISTEERDEEIEKLQAFYQQRIDNLEKKNQELYQTTTEQFAKAVEEVEQKFLKTTLSPVCRELQEDVLRCYQQNANYTLNCSPEVSAFMACVQRQREKILTRKG